MSRVVSQIQEMSSVEVVRPCVAGCCLGLQPGQDTGKHLHAHTHTTEHGRLSSAGCPSGPFNDGMP